MVILKQKMEPVFIAKPKRMEDLVVNYVNMLKMKMEMIRMILYVVIALEVSLPLMVNVLIAKMN